MNSTHLMDEGLALAADAMRLNRFDELPESVTSHLSECQECRLAVMELYQALESVDPFVEHEVPPYFNKDELIPLKRKPEPIPLWIKVAAAVLLLFITGWIARVGGTMDNINRLGRYFAEAAALRQEDPFRADPLVEPLANMVFRGSKLQILSPLPGDTMASGLPISFQWINQVQESVTLSLQDNKGKIIARLEVHRNSFLIDSLQPGRYYWKLESGNALLYLGSFVVCPG